MSLRDVFLRMLGKDQREPAQRQVPQMVESFQIGTPVQIASNITDLYDAFRLLPAAFRAVSVIANTAAKLPISVYRRRKGTDEAIVDHPLAEMLHPDSGIHNPWTSALTGWAATFAFQQLVGNAYLLKDRISRGVPLELHTLRPDWVEVVPGRTRLVDAYLYGPTGSKRTRYEAEQVVPFPFMNPTSPFLGQSPLLPAREAMVLELYMVALQTAFFKNGATLGGVISFEQMRVDAVTALMEQFNAKHQGVKNAHKWRGVVGAQKIEEMGLSNKDLQYAEGLKWTTQSVCTALGVPVMMLGHLDGATFANSREQKQIFYENTIQPVTALRDAQINLHLAPSYERGIYVRTDYQNVDAFLPEMSEVRQTADSAFRSNVISRDEYRSILRTRRMPALEPIDGGAPVYFSDISTQSETSSANDPDNAPDKDPVESGAGADDNVVKALVDAERRARRKAKADKEQKVAARVAKMVSKYEERVGRVFSRQESEIRKGIGELSLTDLSRLDDLIRKASSTNEEDVREGMRELVEVFGPQALADLDAAQSAFDAANPRVLKYLASEAGKKIRFMDQTTADVVKAHIQRVLAQSQAQGEGQVATATEIIEAGLQNGMEIRRARANAIAQTETTAAYNHSDLEAYRQSGVVEEREWATQGDGVTRPSHEAMQGATAKLDEPFVLPSGDRVMFPGDSSLGADASEIVECRCFTMPVLKRSVLNQRRLVALSRKIQKLRAPSPGAMNGKGSHS